MDPGCETLNNKDRNTREGAQDAPSRDLAQEKSRQEGKKSKSHKSKDGDSFNKTSNENELANCRKQMKKPRPAPSLVFDVFSPARS